MRRIYLCLLLFALVVFLAACNAAAEDHPPLLSLVYSANSMGEFRECPVCGAAAQGGLGRRGTVLREVKAAGEGRAILVAGPYEFMPMVVHTPESPDLARALVKAYGLLGYDFGAITAQEAKWLADSGARLPEAFRQLGGLAQTVFLERAGLKIALVLFPMADLAKEPGRAKEVYAAVRSEAGKARDRADLVVGVSPWGESFERELIESAPGAFDMVLGAGKGVGFGIRPLAGGRTLLFRPPFDGRGLVKLDLLALPSGPDRVWAEGKNYTGGARMLDWIIPQAEEVVNVFSWL